MSTDPNQTLLTANRLQLSDILIYALLGVFFGFVLIKGEVISWFRIQEMFRFQSFYMYGVIGTAVAIGVLSLQLIKRFNVKTIKNEAIHLADKPYERGINQWAGGIIFGFGWALTGACPGPIYALIGSGVTVLGVTFISALVGAWVYGALRPRLPH